MEVLESGESVIVVMDAKRNGGNVDALNWALNHVVRPRDTVIVLGILCEGGKKTSCLPFYMGVGISAIWERLEFSGPGDVTPEVLEEEILKKREEYQCILQPLYRQCKKNGVKLEVKLVAGFCPKKITIEEAQNTNTRWVVLDSHLRKDKIFIYGHVGCNIAIMKGHDVATIMPSVTAERELPRKLVKSHGLVSSAQPEETQHKEFTDFSKEKGPKSPRANSPCWAPLSWLPGFPRNFSYAELESITNGFADENIVAELENSQMCVGILMETPVLVQRFSCSDERFWSQLAILSRIRHRHILNLIGYCCLDTPMFLLFDYPCNGPLNTHLESDNMARNLSWKVRWDIALGIGGCLRYLHEECPYGPIWHLAVSSSNVALSHDCSPLLTKFCSAKWIKDSDDCDGPVPVKGPIEYMKQVEGGCQSPDVYGYGLLLLELMTGQTAPSFDASGKGQSLVDWALPLLENGRLSEVTDQRLTDSCDVKVVRYMACAALQCLKNGSGHPPSMSEVVSAVRGNRFKAI